MRNKIGFLGGVAVGVAFVACGSVSKQTKDSVDMAVAQLLDLAGVDGNFVDGLGDGPLGDGASSDGSIFDLPKADAQSGQMFTLDCDKVRVATSTSASATVTSTTYYAEAEIGVAIPSIAPTVVMCEYEVFGTGGGPLACPSGYTCTGYSPPATTCQAFAGATLAGTKAIISCGNRSSINYVDSGIPDSDSGYRWKKVYVFVP